MVDTGFFAQLGHIFFLYDPFPALNETAWANNCLLSWSRAVHWYYTQFIGALK